MPLSNINILIGANNAGKSSILQSIQFAVSIAQTTSLDEFKEARWKFGKLSTSLTANQIIYTPIRDIYSLGHGGTLSQNEGKAIKVTFIEKDTQNRATFFLRKGRNKNLHTTIEGQVLGQQIRDLDNPYSIYVPGLSGIPPFEELRSEGIVRRMAAKGDANNVFRNILWLLKQNEIKWASFLKDFNDIFPDLSISITFDKLKDEYLNASIKRDEKDIPIDAFGTGVLQIIQTLAYIHLYKPKLLILDEPDSHLHPSNQRVLAEKLNEISSILKVQIIISTHSRHLLDAFKEYATVNWISNGAINNHPYDFIKVLLEIGALDKGDILNNGNLKCVVLTEDTKTNKLKAILKSNNFLLEETQIWAYDGCSKIDTAIVLAAFIKSKAPGTTVLIHRDRDYLSDDDCQKLIDKATKANLKLFLTVGTDIESHFLDARHIQTLYPDLSIEEINRFIDEATDHCSTKSIESFVNYMTNKGLQEQYSGGKRLNAGEIATTCLTDYNADKLKFRHGKAVYKVFSNNFFQGRNQKDLIVGSQFLEVNELSQISRQIWPVAVAATKTLQT